MLPNGSYPPQGIPAQGYPMAPQINPHMQMMRPGMVYPQQMMMQPGMRAARMIPQGQGMVPLAQPMPYMPGGGQQPRLSGVQEPRLPTGQVPRFPTGQVPRLPTGQVPRLPTGQMPHFAGGQVPRPPAYTPDMAKDFHLKEEKMMREQQKFLEVQQREYEQQMKQHQFQEQRKRLQEFSALGGRKVDADSMIQSIVGPSEKTAPRPAAAPLPPQSVPSPLPPAPLQTTTSQDATHQMTPAEDGDDGFGDFLGSSAAAEPPSIASKSQPSAETNPDGGTEKGQTQGQGQQERPAEEKKADLVSMMMQCSDFSAPKEAKGFAKKARVNEMAVPKPRAASFKASQKARCWEADNNSLTNLFVNANEVGVSHLPKWMTGDAPVPDVYNLVLEASLREGKIQTELVYPILLRSGLSRETLGSIWQLCNKHEPGVLVKEELFCVLALVSVAQNNITFESLEILKKCVHAPIPNFNIEAAATIPSANPAAMPPANPAAVPPANPAAVPPANPAAAMPPACTAAILITSDASVTVAPSFSGYPPPAPCLSTSNQQPALSPMATDTKAPMEPVEDDDFSDFQTAKVLPQSSASFAEFSSVLPPSGLSHVPVDAMSIMKTNASAPNLVGETDRYTAFRETSGIGDTLADDFGDFKSEPCLRDTASPASLSSSLADTTATAPIAVLLPPPAASSKPLSSAVTNTQSGISHVSQTSVPEKDDFADFQQARIKVISKDGDEVADPYKSLRALVMDKSLYEKKATACGEVSSGGEVISGGDEVVVTDGSIDGDWCGFKADSNSDRTETELDDWADFKSDAPVSWSPRTVDSSMSEKAASRALGSPTTLTRSEMIKVDNSKANKLFSHNLPAGSSAGVGISPLDTLPPDLPPDLPNDDSTSLDNFDHFGTFQVRGSVVDTEADGISSIALGEIDLSDVVGGSSSGFHQKNSLALSASISQSSTRDTFDTQSTSSLEFTAKSQMRANKDDALSMSSLELRESKDLSPVGTDSQSVSSLELPVNLSDSNLKALSTPQDVLSVASLELKTASEADLQPQPYLETDLDQNMSDSAKNDFGEFSSAEQPVHDEVLRPRDASELLKRGDMPNLADRYRGLTQELEDSELHEHNWLLCLEKCSEVLQQACDIIHSIPSPSLRSEVMQSQKGAAYLKSVTEVYRVACRIKQAMNSTSMSSRRLEEVVMSIESSWGTLTVFIASTHIMPPASTLSFHKHVLRAEDEDAQQKACGVCLLNVDYHGPGPNENGGQRKLAYSGRQYHTICANFWVNCVDTMLPALKIPELI